MQSPRQSAYPIDTVFLDRWSARSFDHGEMPLHDLLTILEAGRWAPSAYNMQPWRFLYARRNDFAWTTFVNVLNPFNRSWAGDASALIVLLSDTLQTGGDTPGNRLSRYNSFDAGAAWAQVALQAAMLGYHAHAMAGLEFADARNQLEIPDRYRIEVTIAIGRKGDRENLPEALQGRELPSDRKPLHQIAFHGRFPHDDTDIDHTPDRVQHGAYSNAAE